MTDQELKEFQANLKLNLLRFVGTKNTKKARKAISNIMAEALSNTPGVKNTFVSNCDSAWNKMTIKEKIKWFVYNRFPLKKHGDLERKIIKLQHELDYLEWVDENPDKDVSEFPYRLDMPKYLEPNPKDLVLVDIQMTLASPLEYLNVVIDTDKL